MESSSAPWISPEIFELRPDFRALSIFGKGLRNGPADEGICELLRAACADPGWAGWGASHLESWRDAYRGFGAKPQRTPCSADALRKRVEKDGGLPSVNAVVDLYNALSVRYAVPVGGKDAAAYAGQPRLVRARGGEPFDTVRDGSSFVEPADAGEIVWRDDAGVTCRRWNWRQGTRTRLGDDTTSMWFVIERLDPMPMSALLEAGNDLVRELTRLSPGAQFTTTLLDKAEAAPLPGAAAAR